MAETTIRVLLVEDGSVHAKIVERVLAEAELATFRLTCVESLAAGREILAGGGFDVVLLDPRLPDAGLTEALHDIHVQSPDIPVVVLSTSSKPKIGIEAVAQGAQDFLCKADLFSRVLERVLVNVVRRRELLGTIQRTRGLMDRRSNELENAKWLLDQTNRRLAELGNATRQFFDNVSREFRTPLAMVKECVTTVRDGSAGEINSRQGEFLDIIKDRVGEMAFMVEDMLDVSRSETGTLSVWRRDWTMVQIIEHIRPILERKAGARNVSLKIRLDAELPRIYCDPEKIGRVIVNLATNAVKYCAEGGSVKLWAKPGSDGSDVVVGINNDGPGMRLEDLGTIFEAFETADATSPGTTGALGLGLTVVEELVALNLGEIDVHGELGAGNTFAFSLPVNDAPLLAARYAGQSLALEEKPSVTLVTAEISPSISANDSDLADEFLHQVFRVTDLVIRTLPHKWLIMARADRHEVDAMLARVSGAWAEANGGRPGEKLSEIRFLSAGTWQLPDGVDDFLDCVRSELDSTGPMPIAPSVLVVDEERELADGLRLRLHAAGYDVLTAEDVNAAISSALKHHPNAILMDDHPSEIDGVRAMDRLGEHPDTKDIPVIMLSASIRDQQKALQQGARFFFQKPCNHGTIVAALETVLSDSEEVPAR